MLDNPMNIVLGNIHIAYCSDKVVAKITITKSQEKGKKIVRIIVENVLKITMTVEIGTLAKLL